MRELKNPAAKCYPQWELNSGSSDFHVLHAIAWANSKKLIPKFWNWLVIEGEQTYEKQK